MANSKHHREAERRRLQRQAARRRQRDAQRRRYMLIASIAGAAVITALVVAFVVVTGDESPITVGSASSPATTSAPARTSAPNTSLPSAKAVAKGTCVVKRGGTAARKVTPLAARAATKGSVTALVSTNRGPLVFSLDRAAAPCAVQNFVSLASQHYFDKTPCARLTTRNIFVLQCGDPTGTGSGGPGYQFQDELNGKERYARGTLAMANAGANTNGSQFFIVYQDSPTLPPSYTVFGTVTSGLPVVDKIARAGATTGGDGKPKLATSITRVTIAK